jgi:acyl dehydratase
VGLYFEDFKIGDVSVSRGRTITETDVVAFAGLSGDFIEFHVNEEYAKSSRFGRRIAQGALVFSISTGLMTQMGHLDGTVVAFYGIDRLRFTAPVFIGDTIHIHKKVAMAVKKDAEQGVVTFETTVLNQHGDTVLVYSDKLLIQSKS